jgi:hypothetical protein
MENSANEQLRGMWRERPIRREVRIGWFIVTNIKILELMRKQSGVLSIWSKVHMLGLLSIWTYGERVHMLGTIP